MPNPGLAGSGKYAAYKKAMGGKKSKGKPKAKKPEDMGALAAYMPRGPMPGMR